MIHILASVAEHEATAISQRTIDALGVVKRAIAADRQWVSRRSGRVITRLGNPSLKPGSRQALRIARQARTARADAHATDVLGYSRPRVPLAARRLASSRALTARDIETPAGGRGWSAIQVRRVLKRVDQNLRARADAAAD